MRFFNTILWSLRFFYITVIVWYVCDIFVPFPYKDGRLKPYYFENLEQIERSCLPGQYDLPKFQALYFGYTEGDTVAYCERKRNGYIIVINEDFWSTLNEVGKKQLMMHEMVHCLFKQEHFTNPYHFMAPFFMPMPSILLESQIREYLFFRCRLNY